MLIFYYNANAGGSYSVGPLIALIPFLLTFAPQLLQWFSSPHEAVFYTPNTNLGLIDWLLITVFNLVIPAVGIWSLVRFVRWVRRNGGWGFLLRLLFQGYQAGPVAGGQQRPSAWRRQQQQRRVTVEQVAEALSKLPTERYLSPQQLGALPVHELKALLHGRGLEPKNCLEKGELVRQLLEHGGSSADSCSICCEDYKAGSGQDGAADHGADAESDEVLRVLRCGHRFHVECVDKWFLSATDYTREPACPLCNAPLLQDERSRQEGGAARQE